MGCPVAVGAERRQVLDPNPIGVVRIPAMMGLEALAAGADAAAVLVPGKASLAHCLPVRGLHVFPIAGAGHF